MADQASPKGKPPLAGDGEAVRAISRYSAGKKTATSVPARQTAAVTAAKGAMMAKTADTRTTSVRGAKNADAKQPPASKATSAKRAGKATPTSTRTAAETERIRAALAARREELYEEYRLHRAEIDELQRYSLTDSAGDDQVDTGSKTFEREQGISLANSILERINQVDRAMERLDEGTYGWCERCGNAIPVERLAAFPSATLCVTCKQLEERR